MAKTFEEWWESYRFKYLNGPTKKHAEDAWNAAISTRDADFAALEKRILELESVNAVERERIRDEALVEAARAVDAMICPIPSDYRGMKVSSDLNSRAVCDKILSLRRPR